MLRSGHVQIVKAHVQYLEEQSQALEPILHELNNAINRGKAWLNGRDQKKFSFTDICQELAAASAQACRRLSEIYDSNDEERTNQTDESTDPGSTSTPPGHRSTPTTSGLTDSSRSVAHTDRHNEEVDPRLICPELKVALKRIELAEDAIAAITERSRGVERRQTEMGDRLETVSNLITETNRQLDVKHAQVGELVEQFDRRLLLVDQNVNTLSRLCKEVRQGNVKTSHGENNNGNVDAERNMFLKMVELESMFLQEKSALSGMKESLELLETDVKENSSLLSDLLAKQLGKDTVAGQLEKCYGEVRGLFTRCDEMAASLREMDSSVQEKCGRVPSVEVCRRMETLVTELPVLVEKCQGDCGNVWRTLCQVEENSTKLVDHLTQQYRELELKMNDISNKLQTIEQSHNTKRVAFTGYLSEGNKYKLGSTFDNYAPVWCEHFNSKTGEFTAPADGLYLTSVTFGESEAGRLEVGIYKKTVNDVTERKVHFVEASMAWSSACTVCAVEMSAGDKLYLKFEKSGKTVQFSGNSNFTCIKL